MSGDMPMRPDEFDDAARLSRLWDELGAAGGSMDEVDSGLMAAIRQIEDATRVPPPPPDLAARTWERITGEALPLAPYVPAAVVSRNGHHAGAITVPARPAGRWEAFAGVFRILAIGTLAGMGGGFLTGIWARLVMRLAGFLTVDRNRGLLTQNDAVVGKITLEGTIFIGLFGAALGIVGGLLYIAVRRRLPGSDWQRALGFGVLLLGVFGFVVMDKSNPDYRSFGPAWLNVGSFSLAYIVFGFLTGMLTEWLDRRVPRLTRHAHSRRRNVAIAALLSPFALVGLAGMLAVGVGESGLSGLLFVLLLANALPLSARLRRFPRLTTLLPRPAVVGYAAFAIPSLIGLGLTLRAIVAIVGG
jgi:hypothetical protein